MIARAHHRRGEQPEPGQSWQNKRETWRKVRIEDVYMDGTRVHVRRSTSRRTQSMTVETLWKDYRREDWL